MKIFLAPVLAVVALLAASVLAVAGIHHFMRPESRTLEVVHSPEPAPPSAAPVEPLSIMTAKYSCGSQSADVTQRVRELISRGDSVRANPGCLHADPHPYLNKALVIVYTVEGKPAVLSVGENEKVDRARLLEHAQRESGQAVAQVRADH